MTQLAANQVLDRYTVLDLLGQGGMAMVYRLRHNQLETEHALKVLTITKASVRRRLILEGKVQANLRHQNVVAVTDVLSIAGAPGLLMEYIQGPALDDWLERYKPNLDEIEAIFRGVVAGVGHAHNTGLIHRDLKPANIMVDRSGDKLVPKVADFGLAKIFAEEEEDDEGKRKRTRSGVAMGTPSYMAPEQIRSAKDVDVRADVYSLGCILYEMVTGELAFGQHDLPSIFDAVLAGSFEPVDSHVPDVPERFQNCILGCMHIDANRRIPDCDTLLEVLSGGTWAGAESAGDTWSGSSMDLDANDEPADVAVKDTVASEGGRTQWPVAGFSFSDEALEASYAPKPDPLPTIEEIAIETMGASLLGTMDMNSMDSQAGVVTQQKTVIIKQGGGWINTMASLATVALLIPVLFMVIRSNDTAREAILQPLANAVPIAAPLLIPGNVRAEKAAAQKKLDDLVIGGGGDGVAVVDDGKGENKPKAVYSEQSGEVTEEMKLDDKTIIVNVGPTYVVEDEDAVPEGQELTETEGEGKVTAEVRVDDEAAGEEEKEADVVVQMTTEEIADLPEDKLPPGYGAVSVEGEATSVWLSSDQGRIEPGLVLAGKYRIMATFEGVGEVGAGEVHIPVGKKVTLRCDAMFQKCVR